VFLCDSILQKHAQILSLVCKLAATSESRFVKMKLNSLLNAIMHLRPEFNAARFFFLDKRLLLGILYTIITFLLVIIQFKLNL
jgi:hypothetical protein